MEKERTRSMQASLSMWLLVVGLVSQNLLNAVLSSPHSFEEQKHYYTPAPHAGTPPTGSHHRTPAPTGKCEPTPPKRHKTPPKHHGGNPTPYTPPGGGGSPNTPTPYTPPGGGGSPNTPTPYTPPGGGGSPHTPTPSTPRGGGYYPSPPTSGGSPSPPVVSPPTTPTPVPNPGTPYVPAPETPTPVPNPGTPYVPAPETPTTPSTPPFLPDPNTPGTCDYWKHHPTLVWGVVGWFGLGSLGGAFGHSSLPGISPGLTCLDALSNTLTNGYGALYREGTASLLNSVVNHKFPYSTQEVRDHFASGLASNNAAETQAQLFKMANEGKVKSKA